MPITRQIVNLGGSQVVSLPKSWLRFAEEKSGKKIIAVAMEVDGSITLNPIFEKETVAASAAKQETATVNLSACAIRGEVTNSNE